MAKLGTETQSEEDVVSRLLERHFSPSELAELWNLSEDTVRRIFERESDVLIFENPERGFSRRRRTLRIPESVAERVYRRLYSRVGQKGIECRHLFGGGNHANALSASQAYLLALRGRTALPSLQMPNLG